MKVKLDQYQLDGVKGIIHFHNRALLADEQGTGKTIQALEWLRQKGASVDHPAIIVSPATVKWNWPIEAKRFGFRTDVLSGRKPPPEKRNGRKAMMRHSPLIMVNYDILMDWVPYLRSLRPKFLVLDEAQYIANSGSLRYRAVSELSVGIPCVLLLTGTPVTNRPGDLWGPLSISHPDLFPSENEFLWEYTKRYKYRGRWISKGAKNLDRLHRILKKRCMIRRLKSEVLKELPPKTRHVIEVPLSDPLEYSFAERDFLNWVRSRWGRTRARKAKKVEAFARLSYLLRLCAKLKVREIRKWVEWFLDRKQRKLVIFSQHRPMIEMLLKRFPGKCVRIDGKVHGHKRQLAVEEFQKGRKPLAVCHPRAGGVGITLTAAADVLYTDLPLSAGDLLQSEDRVHRRTQTKPVHIHYMVTRGTVEARAMELLSIKFKFIDQIVDGKESETTEMDIFKELIKTLKRKPRK